mgnify:CR=1 FL=1
MKYRFVKYDNTYEEFIYQTKKQAYKKYVEECFGLGMKIRKENYSLSL